MKAIIRPERNDDHSAAFAAAVVIAATVAIAMILAFSVPAVATPDGELQQTLDSLAAGFRGTVGIYVRHLKSGETAGVNADTVFPTASMVKVPILIATFDAMEQGRLGFLQPMTYADSLLYPGVDILGSFRDSSVITLAKLTMLMITTSDNTASLWLQRLAGSGAVINEWLSSHGYEHTRVNSRTPGREKDREAYGWGQTTPREMAGLLTMIREGRAVSRAASEEMYRHLTRSYFTGEALAPLPPWVQAASKLGAVDRSRSEAVLVNAPSGDYVFCIITKDQADESWEPGNEGWELIRKVSASLWRHFEPDHPWTPAPGAEKYKPIE
jgi:beta-lactamase class A